MPASGAQITAPVDEGRRVALVGNTRPETVTARDLGQAADDTPMLHLLLQLKRSPDAERTVEQLIDALHDPASPQFHHWLDPATFGARFGVPPADRAAITRWLTGHGFTVNVSYGNGMLIDFSGTAGQVRDAFATEIHAFDIAGVRHIANVADPRIPAALAPAIEGVVALHDFKPHKTLKRRPNYTFGCSSGSCSHSLVPADLATIYNFKSAFAAGYTGVGQTVVVIEDSDVYAAADWTKFRDTFGLAAYPAGKLLQVHPAPASGTNNCGAPGVNGDDDEAILDAEWASAAAPNATIEVAACNNAGVADGLLIAIQNVIAAKSHPAIINLSYSQCEAFNGATSNAAYSKAYQQAVAEGISMFVSTGDWGPAACDAQDQYGLVAAHGIGVSAYASTIYNVAVGGTDFSDFLDGTGSTYWSTTNTSAYGSAKSYIPEIPWNGSCASQLAAIFYGFSAPYGVNGFCNSSNANAFDVMLDGGGGGPSGCATGAPSLFEVVGGSCKGWAKPSWQAVLGNPADKVRDVPDVSLFASNAVWDESYVFCYSDPANEGLPCVGAPSNWSNGGGTSFAAPIMAGIQALVNQKMGQPQGNPDPVYYRLARTEFGTVGSAACADAVGQVAASTCVFHDVIRGDIDMPCAGPENCFSPGGPYGVMSTSDTADKVAFPATKGWDFATGIGSVNVFNLIKNWPGALLATTR